MLASRAEHVLHRHLDIVEEQREGVGAAHAELVEVGAMGKALHPFSTMKAVMPFGPAATSVLA
jgi:hypothetical protein